VQENTWDAIAAIATVFQLVITVVLQRKRILDALSSLRTGSMGGLIHATRRVITVVVERAWRPLAVILSIWLLGIWVRDNLLIQPAIPLSSWGLSQYGRTIALAVLPLGLLFYLVVVEPRRRTTQAERSRDLLAGNIVEATDEAPIVATVFYDETFPCSWVTAPDKAASYFESRGFLRANADQIKDRMEKAIEHGTAHQTLFAFIHDVIPVTIAQVLDPSCTLRRYLDAGGRIVWWGDIPLHWRGLPGAMKEEWRGGPSILSVDHYTPQRKDPTTGKTRMALWSRSELDGLVELTDAGHSIGMRTGGQCKRPAGVNRYTVVYSEVPGENLALGKRFESTRWAISWRKVFNTEYPHSGFMQYPCGKVNCNDKSIVQDFFRFSVSGWPRVFPV